MTTSNSLTPFTTPELLVAGYQEIIDRKIDEGWRAYILTFMFNQLSGSRSTVMTKMTHQLQRVYATMLTRIVRNPRSIDAAGRLPIWIAAPDLPVPKNARKSLTEVTINEGLHMHAIALVPPWSRLRTGLAAHIRKKQRLYVKNGETLLSVHAKRMKRSSARATAYSLKSVTRRRFTFDDLLILPRSTSELND